MYNFIPISYLSRNKEHTVRYDNKKQRNETSVPSTDGRTCRVSSKVAAVVAAFCFKILHCASGPKQYNVGRKERELFHSHFHSYVTNNWFIIKKQIMVHTCKMKIQCFQLGEKSGRLDSF